MLGVPNKQIHVFKEISQKKLTKLGICDRYTIEGLIDMTARTARSARLLGLLAETAGTARTARVSALVENLYIRWYHLHIILKVVIWLPCGAACKL